MIRLVSRGRRGVYIPFPLTEALFDRGTHPLHIVHVVFVDAIAMALPLLVLTSPEEAEDKRT